MKIVIAPDSFKGSLSATEAAKIMEKAVRTLLPAATIVSIPMADGGEGSSDVLIYNKKSEKIPIVVTGPLGNRIHTYYYIVDGKKAIIENAMISGLTLVPHHLRHPNSTTTYGLGEAINHALHQEVEEIVVCLGGSSTNDGGLGMLQALGADFLDDRGQTVSRFGEGLFDIRHVSFAGLEDKLEGVRLTAVCDVENPLLGETGCSHTFGKQKGLNHAEIIKYDKQLTYYSEKIQAEIDVNYVKEPHTGSAGGLGFALRVIGAKLEKGAPYIAKEISLETHLKEATFVLTGEGKTDEQTMFGKAPYYIASLANKYQIPVYLISGSITNRSAWRHIYSGIFSMVNEPMSIEKSMGEAEHLLHEQTIDLIYFLRKLIERKE
ncbi:MAG TPA: glycerate kinase [Pseudogracilibacillus sp.]|nr:glycerate kinase [Pseudogracilibacillus sp.]